MNPEEKTIIGKTLSDLVDHYEAKGDVLIVAVYHEPKDGDETGSDNLGGVFATRADPENYIAANAAFASVAWMHNRKKK